MSDIVQMDELEEAERKAAKPRWKRRQFWHTAIPLFVSACLLVVGTTLAIQGYQTQVSYLPVMCLTRNLCHHDHKTSDRCLVRIRAQLGMHRRNQLSPSSLVRNCPHIQPKCSSQLT